MRHRWGSNPGFTDRLIVGRNVTFTLTIDRPTEGKRDSGKGKIIEERFQLGILL
jgi:hypothetical protein